MTRMPALRCLLAAFAAMLFLVADAPGEPPPVRAAVGDIFEFPIPTPGSQPGSLVRAWDGNVRFNGISNKIGRLGTGGIDQHPERRQRRGGVRTASEALGAVRVEDLARP